MARRKRRTVAEFGPHPVDVHVGGRVRLRRSLLGMSQTQLAEVFDLSFQQFQKYERGFNRISASRLYQLCHVLDVPIEYFFEGLEDNTSRQSPDDVMAKTETMKLVRAHFRIRDPKVRETLRRMAIAMAKGAESP